MGLLEDKVAIVTGAGGGLGRAEALELSAQGAAIVVNDVGTNVFGQSKGGNSPADQVVATIRAQGGRAVANYGDVGDWATAKALVEQAIDEFGRLDILVNNAGILRKGSMLDMEEADLRDLLHVHVKGTVVPTQHAGRYWRTEHRAGRTIRPAIVNTTSRAGLATRVPEIAWYSAAKGAVAAFTMAAALELAEFGIRVNAIAPHSFTRQDAAAAGVEYDPSKNQALAPDKVAPVVAWLASESSAPINGKIFWVEGGIVSHYERWRAGHTITTEGRWDAAAIGPALRAVGFEG